MHRVLLIASLVLGFALVQAAVAWQDEEEVETPRRKPSPKQLLEPPVGLTRIAKDQKVWVDLERKCVVADGVICLREGQLEMFACPKGTKEHESVVSIESKARFIHAGLLRVGAKPGSPVKFAPEYEAATGPVIEIFVVWKDEEGKEHKAKAQEWVRNVKTEKLMTNDWVFAGSGFWTDDSSGEEHYYADNGDLVCVSNFATAMLDLPIESSKDAGGLLFTANTEKIPLLGTPVRLVFQLKQPAKEEGKKAESPKTETAKEPKADEKP